MKSFRAFNHLIELDWRAKCSFFSLPRIYRRNPYRSVHTYFHFVWWKFSVIISQPWLEQIEVHRDCLGEVQSLAPDGISFCKDCEVVVEGETEHISLEEFERRHA